MPIGKDPTKISVARLLDEYDKLRKGISAFRHKHVRVFDQFAEMSEKAESLESRIKSLIQESYEGKESGRYTAFKGDYIRATVTSKYERKFDINRMLRELPEIKKLPGVVELKVNKKALDDAIESKYIDQADINPFISYVQMTSSVQFQLVTDPEDK